jgi:hypothetical protein
VPVARISSALSTAAIQIHIWRTADQSLFSGEVMLLQWRRRRNFITQSARLWRVGMGGSNPPAPEGKLLRNGAMLQGKR